MLSSGFRTSANASVPRARAVRSQDTSDRRSALFRRERVVLCDMRCRSSFLRSAAVTPRGLLRYCRVCVAPYLGRPPRSSAPRRTSLARHCRDDACGSFAGESLVLAAHMDRLRKRGRRRPSSCPRRRNSPGLLTDSEIEMPRSKSPGPSAEGRSWTILPIFADHNSRGPFTISELSRLRLKFRFS